MSKKFDDYKNFEIAFPDSSGGYDENYFFQRKLFSGNNEESKPEEKTEILWSRENKYFYENDLFSSNGDDSFSDLTGRSTSSCSWHNDEFDMKSSTKVTKSLEAVDNALYEKQLSPFISEEVFQECCNWSNKFPYFRLKGEQIVKYTNDSVGSYKVDQKEGISTSYSPFSLHVEGKKIALRTPEKSFKKSNFDIIPEFEQATFFDEEIDDDDGVDNCFVVSQSENVNVRPIHSEQLVANSETISIDFLQDKVIERLAQHMWPKVLEVLQKCHTVQKSSDKIDENFQLPPIVAAQMEHKRFIPTQRPKTEGTSLSMTDFPKLSSILSVSPKILQDRKECKSGKSSLRSSRPSSEIHLTSRNNSFSSIQNKNSFQKTSRFLRTPNTPKQVQFISKKSVKNDDKVPLYLPALEEDIADPIDYLKGFSLQNESKTISTSVISHFPKNSECFLPPIDTDHHLQSDAKLTRNLFTFFGTDLKCSSKRDMVHKPKTPASRPNTSASKRGVKQTDALNYRFINDTFSSISNSNPAEIRKVGDNAEKQVTLFPIVTSLIPSRERNSNSSKKGFLNTFSGRKR